MSIKGLATTANIAVVSFVALMARIVYMGANWGDAVALATLMGFLGYQEYLKNRDDNWKKEVESRLDQVQEEFETKMEDVKNVISAVKMDKSVRRPNAQGTEKIRYF